MNRWKDGLVKEYMNEQTDVSQCRQISQVKVTWSYCTFNI